MNYPASDNPQFTLKQLLLTVTVIAVVLAVAAPWLRSLIADWGENPAHMGLILLLVALGLMLVLGIAAVRSSRTNMAAWSEGFSHAIGIIGVLALIVVIVPAFERIFKEFDVPLPAMTLYLLTVSNAVARYAYLVMPLMAAFVACDVVTFRQLHASAVRRPWAKAWSATITAIFLAAVLFSITALFAPLI